MKSQRSSSSPNVVSIAGEMHLARGSCLRALPVEEHEPDRFVGGPTARAGDARDGDGHVDAEAFSSPNGHGLGRLRGDRSVSCEELPGHAERGLLRLVRVGDDAAYEHVARARNRGEAGGDESAGRRLAAPSFQPRERHA